MPPLVMGRDTPLYACFEEHPKYEDGYKMAAELREMYATDPDAQQVIDVARGLEGLRRQDGIHAAAVVITKEPLTEYLPIQRKPEAGVDPERGARSSPSTRCTGSRSSACSRWTSSGLRNLDVIADTARADRARTDGVDLDIDDVAPRRRHDLRAAARRRLHRRVPARGRRRCARCMRSLAPTTFEDVAALVALYRPGPMAANMHNDYADRKNGRKPIEYLHPDLEEILGRHLRPDDLPGVGDAGGAEVRRLLARRGRQPAQGLRQEDPRAHRQGAREVRGRLRRHGLRRRASAPHLFDIIEPFADYAFNKSHSYGYGFIAYQTAYLKAHYPVEYLAALLTSVKTNLDKAAVYLNECRQHGHRGARPRRQRVEHRDFTVGVERPRRQAGPSPSGCRRCATSARGWWR